MKDTGARASAPPFFCWFTHALSQNDAAVAPPSRRLAPSERKGSGAVPGVRKASRMVNLKIALEYRSGPTTPRAAETAAVRQLHGFGSKVGEGAPKRTADFPVCRVADFQIGGTLPSPRTLTAPTPRQLPHRSAAVPAAPRLQTNTRRYIPLHKNFPARITAR